MSTDLLTLKIAESELEELSGIEITELMANNLYSHVFQNQPVKIFSFVFHQILIFAFTLVISCPVTLIFISKINLAPEESQVIILFWQIAFALSLLITIAYNIYVWFKIKPLAVLIKIVEEINKYNQIIDTVSVVDKFVEAGNYQLNLSNRKETIEGLELTRENLICAVKTERIIRENQNLMDKKYELFLTIENNFSALTNNHLNEQISEYTRLLDTALEINTSIHKEMLKLN